MYCILCISFEMALVYGLCWCYNHKNHLVISSTTLVFVTNMSEKHKSTSPSAIQVKNQQKTIGNEDKSDVIIGLEKGE